MNEHNEKKISFFAFISQYVLKNLNICFIILISLILPGILIIEYMKELEFSASSVPAKASIYDKRQDKAKREWKKSVYKIFYSYKTPSGAIVRTSDSIGKSKWEKLRPGDEIEIRYLKDRPQESRIWKYSLLINPFSYSVEDIFFPFIITFLFLIQGLWFLFFLKKDKDSIQDIFLSGIAGDGEIIKTSYYNDKRAAFYDIRYKFQIENGKTYYGNFNFPCRYESSVRPKEEDKGKVLYLAENPYKNVWIGENWRTALPITRRVGFNKKEERKNKEKN